MRPNFTEDEVALATSDRKCLSIAAVIRKLSLKSGKRTSYDFVYKVSKSRNIDTSHWLGRKIGITRKGKPTKDVLLLLRIYDETEYKPIPMT